MKNTTYRVLAVLMTTALLCACLGTVSFADKSKNVTISIPTFKVQVQDMSVDSSYMQYPLIVYNDITYFPLTWNWCQKMSLSVAYTQKDGLHIIKRNMDGTDPEKMDNGSYQPAGKRYTATVANYPVYINGVKIDNSKEQYPLLNFRNITYFPLTWRFVVDEFCWHQSWDKVNGLKITTWDDSDEYDGKHQSENYRVQSYLDGGEYVQRVYNDYAIISKGVGDKEEFYQLNYADDTFTKIDSEEVSDASYNSGRIKKENVSDLFTKEGTKVLYNGNLLYDLASDAGEKNTVEVISADRYQVNAFNVYLLTVYTTQEGQQVPAPYTPHYQYVFVDKGDGKLVRIDEWRIKTDFSAVYDNGKGGFYLTSYLTPYGTSRYMPERARVYNIDKNLNVDVLNDKWKDWRSTEAIGSDKDHNLYLINTWYAKSNPDDNYTEDINLISPINDGYFKLSPDGELTKIYPYVEFGGATFDMCVVTPNGQVYLDADYDFDERGILHLQTAKWIKP